MRKYNLNENFFDKLTEKSSYWLGFLYADGYVRMKDGKSKFCSVTVYSNLYIK